VRTTGVRSIHLGHNVKNHIVSQHDFDAPKQANIDVMLSEIWSLGALPSALHRAILAQASAMRHEVNQKRNANKKQALLLSLWKVLY
jgi:hypothetical protein